MEFLAFAAALADAAENAYAFMLPDHVVDHLGEQHRLAHARPAEQAGLAAALQRHQHVNDLDARLEHRRLGGTPSQGRRRAVHGTPLHIGGCSFAVDGVAKHVEHSRKNSPAHRCFQRSARILDRHAAGQSLRGGQRNPAHMVRVELRQNLDADFTILGVQQGVDRRQSAAEADVHHAAAYRNDHARLR